MSENDTPEEVLEAIMATGPRPQKAKNLALLQDVCTAVFEVGPRDFSRSNIGKICEEKGIMKARGLYNEAAKDYCRLISAWERRAGPQPPRIVVSTKPTEAYVKEIQDPVLRMLVQRDLAKLAKMTSELNVLKSTTKFTIDRRPMPAIDAVVLDNVKSLEDFELRALRRALSPEFLKRRGWEVTKLGEVVSDTGRTVFEPGFATGLRKLLGEF